MKKKVFYCFIALLILAVSQCLGDEWDNTSLESTGMKKEVKQYSESCFESVKPGFLQVASFLINVCNATTQPQIPVEYRTKCYISCILNRMKIMNVVNEGLTKKAEFDPGMMKQKVDEWNVDKKAKPAFMGKLNDCAKTSEAATDKCEVGFDFLKCLCISFKQKKPENGPKQDEVVHY